MCNHKEAKEAAEQDELLHFEQDINLCDCYLDLLAAVKEMMMHSKEWHKPECRMLDGCNCGAVQVWGRVESILNEVGDE